MSDYIVSDEWLCEFEDNLESCIVGDRFEYDSASNPVPPLTRIVRCRDCAKWHHVDTEDGVRFGECDEWRRPDSYCVPATQEDGFCYWAKRKEVRDD